MRPFTRYLLIVVVLAVLALACSYFDRTLTGIGGPEAPVEALPYYADPLVDTDSCNASDVLSFSTTVLLEEVNQYNTRLCDFVIRFENTSTQDTIQIYGYQHKADVWQDLDQSEWLAIRKVGPGEIFEWSGYHTIYNDVDAQGPTMLVLERVSVVYDTVECKELADDTTALDIMSSLVQAACSPIHP